MLDSSSTIDRFASFAHDLGMEDTAYQARVFSDVMAERDRIIGAFFDAETTFHLRLAAKLLTCCRSAMVFTDSAGDEVRLSERRCRSRCCPRCRRFRSREMHHKLLEAVTRMDERRFVTLTLESNDDPLADQLKHLRKSFARLRRQAFWKNLVVGGVYCIELTYNLVTRQWHPHIHAVIDGSYVPKATLRSGWHEATGDSYIVDIQYVRSASRVSSYVAKYVAKSDDASGIPDFALAEWSSSVHGLRLIHAFGNLHGVHLVEKPERSPGLNIELINPSVLASEAARGDLVASSILTSLEAAPFNAGEDVQRAIVARVKVWQGWQRVARQARMKTEAAARPPPAQPVLFNGQLRQ